MQDNNNNKYLTLRPTKDNPAFVFISLPKPCGKLTSQRIYIKHQPSLEHAWALARNLRDRLGRQYWGEGWTIESKMTVGVMVNPLPNSQPTPKPTPKPKLPAGASQKTVGAISPQVKQKEVTLLNAERQLFEIVPGVTEVFFAVPLGSPPVGVFKVDYEDKAGDGTFHIFRFGKAFPRLDALYAALKCKQEIEQSNTGRKSKCKPLK